MNTPDKNNPPAQWIETLRSRFPCEREIDRVLTRKMRRRGGEGYVPQTLEALVEGVSSLIRAEIGEAFEIRDPRWLAGGASKLQMAFMLEWTRPGSGRERTPMVLRMEPAESLVESSRLREFEVIRAYQGVVPVPEVFWVDRDGDFLPYPAIVYSFVAGVTKPSGAQSQATGMGTYMAPQWRATLGPQFVETLAHIHACDLSHKDLGAFDVPAPGTHSIELALNHWERVWEEDADEDIPLMRLACAWMRENMPACPRPVMLHGDYRVGNFLFTEHDARFSTVLDWEMARFGDHHFDLAWAANPAYGTPDDAGRGSLVGGFMPEQEFFDRYEQHSGLAVDASSLYFHKVYIAWLQGVISLGTGWRVAYNGKTHQDALVAWIVGIGPKLIDGLRELLEQGA